MTTDNTSRDTPDRMDVPFVGLATFARQPACPDRDKLNLSWIERSRDGEPGGPSALPLSVAFRIDGR
jgi:hypothetical protein